MEEVLLTRSARTRRQEAPENLAQMDDLDRRLWSLELFLSRRIALRARTQKAHST